MAVLGSPGLPKILVGIRGRNPGKSGTLSFTSKTVGHFGELHPSVLNFFDTEQKVVGFQLILDNIGNLPVSRKKFFRCGRMHPAVRYRWGPDRPRKFGPLKPEIWAADGGKIWPDGWAAPWVAILSVILPLAGPTE